MTLNFSDILQKTPDCFCSLETVPRKMQNAGRAKIKNSRSCQCESASFFSRGGDVFFLSGRVKMVVDIRQTDGRSEYYS